MKGIGTRPIRTQRLYLRSPCAEDAEPLRRIHSLAMPLPDARRTVIAMAEESARPFGFHWVITADGQVVGRIKGWEVNPYNGYVQLGYDIGAEYRCRGYMTEAVRAVIRYLLMAADAHRVYCSVRESNPASCRVCEKNGMRHEGTLRQHYARQDGGYDDVRIYGILREDLDDKESESIE